MEKKNNIEDIFKVPDGYFNQLPLEIHQKIKAKEKKLKIQWYSAASIGIAASLIAGLFWINNDIPKNTETSEHQIETNKDSIKKIINNDSLAYPIKQVNKQKIENIKTSIPPAVEIEELTEEEILEYLIEQEIEIDLS
jgi:hypothetical protein